MKTARQWVEEAPAGVSLAKPAAWRDWVIAIREEAVRWAAEQQRESDAGLFDSEVQWCKTAAAGIRENPLVQLPKCTCAYPYRTDGEVHDKRCPSWDANDEHKRDMRPGRERILEPKDG